MRTSKRAPANKPVSAGKFLALGGNIGDVPATFTKAIDLLAKRDVRIIAQSPLYRTEPMGGKAQDWYHNQVIEIETELTPPELLHVCMETESKLGRVRTDDQWASRTLDIDILFFDEQVLNSKELTLPHPGIAQRRFVLVPLHAIAPDFIHPVLKKSIAELLSKLNNTDQLQVLPV